MRVGLISDTHIPYRASQIPVHVLDALVGVDVILHAGDVDEPWALEPLRDIAPVYAVRGNYHILDGSKGGESLPESLTLDLAGFRVAVAHGHPRGLGGLTWRLRSMVRNWFGIWKFPAFESSIARSLLRRFPDADVIVFGHTHVPYEERWGHTLVVNPGAALLTSYFDAPFVPSIAHLILRAGASPRLRWFEFPD